jgi:hypothetical protein
VARGSFAGILFCCRQAKFANLVLLTQFQPWLPLDKKGSVPGRWAKLFRQPR